MSGNKGSQNFGMKVRIKFKENSGFKGGESILRNVTEIHYNFLSLVKDELGIQVAFESDIQGTGLTHRVSDIKEFETELETKKEKSF